MSGERILMMKQRNQNADKGSTTFTRLRHSHKSHATPYHEQWRKLKVEGCDYGQNVHIELNTSLPIQDFGLKLTCAAGSTTADEFCEAFGTACISHVTFKINGRNILEYDYQDALLACANSFKYEEDVEQLKLISGGAKGNAERTVIAPLFFFSDSISHGINQKVGHRRPFANPSGSKLEIEVTMAEKSECVTGSGCEILNAEFISSELLLPAATEQQLRQPIAVAPRSIYRSLPEFNLAANVEKEIRLESMCAAGNWKNCWVYARANKGSGADKEFPEGNCVHPSKIELQINGTSVMRMDDTNEIEWHRWTSGQNVQPNKCHIISFAELPYDKTASSGFLPANLDAVSLKLTFPSTVDVRLVFELEKVIRVDGMSRYSQSDK